MATTKKTPGTAVAVKKASNVVSIQDTLRAQAAAMSDRIAPPSGNLIRVTQDKKFVLPDGTKTEGPLDLVIVDFVSRNEFYVGEYDPNAISPPACFAISPNPRTMAPSDNSPEKQAETCGECPMNVFGSKGNGKACKNTRYMAVLPPDATEDTPIWLLKTSPTAIKGFDAYVGGVQRAFQMPPVGVVTSVSFDDGQTYATMTFSDARPNEQLATHFARQEEATAMLMAEPDVSNYGQTPAKAPARAPARKTVAVRR